MNTKSILLASVLFGGAIVVAYFCTRLFPAKQGFGRGGSGGGRGGGGMGSRGGGGRGGSGLGRGGIGRGGGGIGRGGWRGRGRGGWGCGRGGCRGRGWQYGPTYGDSPNSWPWWWAWWYDPFYFVEEPQIQNIEEDPCGCFERYKDAMDSGVIKEEAKKILVSCIDRSISGSC